MELETYKKTLQEIQARHRKEINALHIQYGLSKALYKIGDIIKNSSTIIKIEKISVDFYGGNPNPYYIGKLLKKDLAPMKKNESDSIYQNNTIELVKKAE